MDCCTPGFPVLHCLPEFAQTHVHWISGAIQSSHPLLLLPPIPPSIRGFSNESTLRTRWSKYWSFSFNISPSNEHPGLIYLRMDWLHIQMESPISKGLSSVFSNTTVQKHQFFGTQLSSQSNSHIHNMITGKTIALTRRTFVASPRCIVDADPITLNLNRSYTEEMTSYD